MCFIHTCPCCNKEYSNLRYLSAENCKSFLTLDEPSNELAVWYRNSKMQWELECRGRKWLRCDHCCALYLHGRGKPAEHTKTKCAKWQAKIAAGKNASVAMNALSLGMGDLSLSGVDISFLTDTGSSLGTFGSEGEVVESGECNKAEVEKLEINMSGPQRDQESTRELNISKMLSAGYLGCGGMDLVLQKCLFEQVPACPLTSLMHSPAYKLTHSLAHAPSPTHSPTHHSPTQP